MTNEELAKECGATLTISQGENGWFNDGGAIFQKEQLTAFAAAIRRKTLEEAAGMLGEPVLWTFIVEGQRFTGKSKQSCELAIAQSNIKEDTYLHPLFALPKR